MGRKPGLSGEKMGRIISILVANPDGLWLRELARKCGCTHATISRYLDSSSLRPLLLDDSIGKPEKPALRLIRLKPFVIERLQQGQSLDQIMRFLRLMNKAEK
jgi:predicted DNA-binding transcriptional regulator YafY